MITNPADATIIHTSGLGGPLAWAFGRACRLRRKPYIAMIGGQHVNAEGRQSEYFKGADSVVTLTNHQKDELLASDAFPSKRIEVIPLGPDVNEFAPSGVERPGAEKHLLFVARISEDKGLDLALRTIWHLRRRGVACSLDVIGPIADQACWDSGQGFVTEHGLTDDVMWHGAVDHRSMPEFFAKSDLLLFPSRSEGFGMAIVESMACGTPAVALKGSGGPEGIIKDGQDGILTDERHYSLEVEKLLSEADRLVAMSRAARRAVVGNFSSVRTREAFERVLLPALDRATRRNQPDRVTEDPSS
jgi:glycosyltransferase involved in cell wall biosynthesis